MQPMHEIYCILCDTMCFVSGSVRQYHTSFLEIYDPAIGQVWDQTKILMHELMKVAVWTLSSVPTKGSTRAMKRSN